jgi:hypothetical protein
MALAELDSLPLQVQSNLPEMLRFTPMAWCSMGAWWCSAIRVFPIACAW